MDCEKYKAELIPEKIKPALLDLPLSPPLRMLIPYTVPLIPIVDSIQLEIVSLMPNRPRKSLLKESNVPSLLSVLTTPPLLSILTMPPLLSKPTTQPSLSIQARLTLLILASHCDSLRGPEGLPRAPALPTVPAQDHAP